MTPKRNGFTPQMLANSLTAHAKTRRAETPTAPHPPRDVGQYILL